MRRGQGESYGNGRVHGVAPVLENCNAHVGGMWLFGDHHGVTRLNGFCGIRCGCFQHREDERDHS